MGSEIGCYLQQLRAVRRISTSQLALRAGIGRATLHRWQAGKGRPRLQELEAVLTEMAVSPMERTSALTLLTSSGKRLRREADEDQLDYVNLVGPQPHCGDLLRALRLRNEKTQAEVAQFADTTQATVARWECAEVWPERARLQPVARALAIRNAEFSALLCGPLLIDTPSPCIEALLEQFQVCCQGPFPPEKAADAELVLLRLAAHTWLLACHNSDALKLLADIFTIYAERLYFQRRFAECEQVAQRAQDIYLAIGDEADPYWARAVLRGASALAQKSSQRAIERALRQLRAGFPGESSPVYNAWMLSELGKMVAMRGNSVEAEPLGRGAVALAQSYGDLSELAWRQEDMARIYLLSGRSQEALQVAPSPVCHPTSHFVHAEAHRAMGRIEEAREALRAVTEWLETKTPVASHTIPYYRVELQSILEKLPD